MILPNGLELRIHVENGEIKVTGPIDDKLLCYALLGVAHDTIKDFTDQKAKAKVLPVTNGDILNLRPRG